jgi:hypothetical protein
MYMADVHDNDKHRVTSHPGSMGTDRNPPSGTESEQLSEEELIKKRIEELRKRDPFIYR